MPRWDYLCSACGFKDEVIGPIGTLPVTVCPRCQGCTMERQPAATNFILKGSGWTPKHYGDK